DAALHAGGAPPRAARRRRPGLRRPRPHPARRAVRVAILHNRYARRGGEDSVVETEALLLRKAGCEVSLFTVGSADLVRSRAARWRAALRARWNPETVAGVARFLAEHPADVAHVHNFFPVLSPSAHATLRRLGVPVVQTLHNYRLVCANGIFLRE